MIVLKLLLELIYALLNVEKIILSFFSQLHLLIYIDFEISFKIIIARTYLLQNPIDINSFVFCVIFSHTFQQLVVQELTE